MNGNILRLVLGYLLLVNLTAFILYGMDKDRAKRHAWRIPETTLIMAAWTGGAYGAILGMHAWHHKTKKKKFQILIPLAVTCWTVLLGYGVWRSMGW